MIKRILVEKIDSITAKEKLFDLKKNLGIEGLRALRLFNCYDVDGISDETFEKCKNTVFSESPVDRIFTQEAIVNTLQEDEYAFRVKFLPGQFDQRADSAVQCIQAVTEREGLVSNAQPSDSAPLVETSILYVLKGSPSKALTQAEINQIKAYFINPVECCEASLTIPERLGLATSEGEDTKEVFDFIAFKQEQLEHLHKKMSMAMSLADLLHCQDYFKTEQRNPTETELKVLDTYWSDHCRHTTFLTEIEDVAFEEGAFKPLFQEAYRTYLNEFEKLGKGKNPTLMSLATLAMKALRKKGYLQDLDESDEINACSINIKVQTENGAEDWILMFKNETHNHPTEIEPFGGAATCLGGAIRDPLSGRTYVYQAMRVTGSGDPRIEIKDTLKGKLPQRKITLGAAAGYSAYGNQIGLATGLVREIYHEGYVAKRMEIGAVLGAAKKSHIFRAEPTAGDAVILVGGRTGRDGCGGATGSSKGHTQDSLLGCGAEVQKGNPPTERKLQRLFRNPEAARLIKRCNDFGAGGVSVAVGELAPGLVIDLDQVPKKYEGLNGTELAISESQERMAVVVAKEDVERFIAFSREENLEAVQIAQVTDENRLVMSWKGKKIVNISRDFLNSNGAKQSTKVQVMNPDQEALLTELGLGHELSAELDLSTCGQKGLGERFDSTIGVNTVLMPFGGKYQMTPIEAMAAKIPVEGDTDTVSLMSYGYNPKLSTISPFHGAVYALLESIAKIVATGGDYSKIRLTLQEYFERPGKEPSRWGKPFAALLGAYYTQMMLKIPAIGGKDSMSGSFMDLDVPPTLVSFAVNVSDAKQVVSPELKKVGSNLFYLDMEYDAYFMPNFERLSQNFKAIQGLIQDGKLLAVRSIGAGGLRQALLEMSLGNRIGLRVKTPTTKGLYGAFVVETNLSLDEIEASTGMKWANLGITTDEGFYYNEETYSLPTLEAAWLRPLEAIFPTGLLKSSEDHLQEKNAQADVGTSSGCTGEDNNGSVPDGTQPIALDIPIREYPKQAYSNPASSPFRRSMQLGAKPTVFMPVFPGTNCEYDMSKAFVKAGAQVQTLVIRNLTVAELEESINEMAKRIGESQMIALPGGFSAGDEPEGSGKFIAAVFRNPRLTEAVRALLARDGLMLGICNGFQALVKLGLLPYGDISPIREDSPTLTFNEINRHISCLARTRVLSNKSPWLWLSPLGEASLVPVSHGEGRFVAKESVLKQLAEQGQIATQYVDFDNKPSMDIRFNPNGSMLAIEGITSLDGRILGKMGHSERIAPNLYKNCPGNFDTRIFEAGVRYFS